jgi:hypothetical protein
MTLLWLSYAQGKDLEFYIFVVRSAQTIIQTREVCYD